MRVFVGYGYNERDAWIERQILPILNTMSIETVHGKDMHGQVLSDGVKKRIDDADALIGFCTLRAGQRNAAFNSHIWVRDEMSHALALNKPVVEVREKGVKSPPALQGDRQRIPLDLADRLSCISELLKVVAGWSMRKLLLVPKEPKESRKVLAALTKRNLTVKYRSRANGADSQYRIGRLEKVDQGLYLNAIGLPSGSYVQVVGESPDGVLFDTGWATADLVRVFF